MKDFLLRLLLNYNEISPEIVRLTHEMPGHRKTAQEFAALEKEVRARVGFDLYDRYASTFARFLDYDIQAAYALGLGLRKELIKSLEL